ncbi:aminotransferase class III-fold pyridoxal phosphate-dependent enzyme [Streptomyces sp. NPDC096080]|uniref:aminotransferase class III-fold pyridoxal phosphate-dependent enzyme n=1 Tax=Streptomyces sp. NPDC096080 TaxID=3156693 RepID=UPI003325E901
MAAASRPAPVDSSGNPTRRPPRTPAARGYAGALPIVPVRARGLTVEGADGRRYLDCLSGDGTLVLGHNHPVVLAAIRDALASDAPLNAPESATPVKEAFLSELLRTLPSDLADGARVRFCAPSGAQATQTALELVRSAPGRTPVALCFYGGADPADAQLGTSAALFVDPLRGGSDCGGDPDNSSAVLAPNFWMRDLRYLAAARSIPLIADETRTGVARTGAFWAVDHSGITPDVMVLSRAVAAGLPLSVVVHRDSLDTEQPGTPAAPFRGNQLALAAGAATLAHVRTHGLATRAAALGARMLSQLDSLRAEFSCIRRVRGQGLMIDVEVLPPEADTTPEPSETFAAPAAPATRLTSTPFHHSHQSLRARPGAEGDPGLAVAVQRACLERGLIVGLDGPRADVLRLLPPLTVTDEQAAAVLDRFADAVASVSHAPAAPDARSPFS